MNFNEDFIFFFLLSVLMQIAAIVIFWWLFVKKNKLPPDEALLDFLQQMGYSVQYVPSDHWGVTDQAHKLVGNSTKSIRGAILSAIDAQVTTTDGR